MLQLYDIVAVMQTIDASNNSFSDALPATVLEGIWLQSLDYSVNYLTGSIASNVTSFLLEVSISDQVKQCVGLQTCTKQTAVQSHIAAHVCAWHVAYH